MEDILMAYYEDNARKLHTTVDRILLKFGELPDRDLDDFYSLANEVFADVIRRYDDSQSFDTFLYSCLSNKIKSEMTKRNREKRKADRMLISIDTPVGDSGDITIGDTIADSFMIEREVFDNGEDGFSGRMMSYLNRLSKLQRDVLRLGADGYLPGEIKKELHISDRQYADCCKAIHSYRNVSVLF